MAAHGTQFQRIWMPLIILFLITAVEFLIAFTVGPEMKTVKVTVFIALTILKAFYIMAYFMHLKFEKVGLVYSLLAPTLFVVALIFILLYESAEMPQGMPAPKSKVQKVEKSEHH
mgnify:CR=1 FL=1